MTKSEIQLLQTPSCNPNVRVFSVLVHGVPVGHVHEADYHSETGAWFVTRLSDGQDVEEVLNLDVGQMIEAVAAFDPQRFLDTPQYGYIAVQTGQGREVYLANKFDSWDILDPVAREVIGIEQILNNLEDSAFIESIQTDLLKYGDWAVRIAAVNVKTLEIVKAKYPAPAIGEWKPIP